MKNQTLQSPRARAIARPQTAPVHAHSAVIWLALALAAGLCTASVVPLIF